MPCAYTYVKLRNMQEQRERDKKRAIARKKRNLLATVKEMGFTLQAKKLQNKNQTLYIGTNKKGEQIEILFHKNDGKFLVHFSNVSTHDQEHEILDKLITELAKIGYAAELEHFHGRPPKVPILDLDKEPPDAEKDPDKKVPS